MLIHSITIYNWPVSLIKDLEKWSRNFIWSGNVNQRKLITVAWHKVCLPFNEGGLGLRSLSKINEAGNLKMCWDLVHSTLQWAQLLKARVFKNSKYVSYHISSSIWNGIKHKFPDIVMNCSWQIGNGDIINFWTDTWCGEPLISLLNIPQNIQHNLKSTVSCFIHNASWQIPQAIMTAYPSLHNLIDHVTLHVLAREDSFLWNYSHDGILSFKDAYNFHCQIGQQLNWAKLIWNSAIPPSKSILIWRCFHGKLPTDENLSKRGCCLPSICSLCGSATETTQHIVIDCPFAIHLWNWLGDVLAKQCNFVNLEEPLKLCSAHNSPLCNLVILAAIINTFNVIWFSRNQCRFNDKKINSRSAINLIISSVALSGNNSQLKAKSCIEEFVTLKAFNVHFKGFPPPSIKEVLWQPPVFNWIKCNSDGASLGNPGPSSCGGIFRNSNAEFLGAFAYNLGISNSLCAELNGAMYAVEIAHRKGWKNLWLETDSMLVVSAFKSSKTIPWQLKNRWDNCILLLISMNFFVTHIFREGNTCADKFANLGLSILTINWWSQPPFHIREDIVRNMLGLPYFRFG
jgi:ribonuclease HI